MGPRAARESAYALRSEGSQERTTAEVRSRVVELQEREPEWLHLAERAYHTEHSPCLALVPQRMGHRHDQGPQGHGSSSHLRLRAHVSVLGNEMCIMMLAHHRRAKGKGEDPRNDAARVLGTKALWLDQRVCGRSLGSLRSCPRWKPGKHRAF